MRDVFTRETISQGHLLRRTFFRGRNLEEIFSEDENPGTFRQGHFLKDIPDVFLFIDIKQAVFEGQKMYYDESIAIHD
jgi:hypothetical protein